MAKGLVFKAFITVILISAINYESKSQTNNTWTRQVSPVIKVNQSDIIEDLIKNNALNDNNPIEIELKSILTLMDSGEFKIAIKSLNKLIYRAPDLGYPHLLKGLNYISIGKSDSALYEFYGVLKTKDFHLYGEARIQIGQLRMFDGEFEKALIEFEIAERLLPNSPVPNYCKGALLVYQNNLIKAKSHLDKAIDKDSQYYPAYKLKAQIFIWNGRYGAAENELRKYLLNDSVNYEAFIVKGLICENKNEEIECLDSYKSAIRLDRKNPVAYKYLGLGYLNNNEYANGIKFLAKSLQIDRKLSLRSSGRWAYSNEELYKDAILLINNELDSLSYEALRFVGKGIQYLSKYQPQYAIKEFLQARRFSGESVGVFVLLGYAQYSVQQNEEALNNFLSTTGKYKSFEIERTIARIYKRIGDNEKCIRYLQKAIKIDPENFDCIEELGDMYFKEKNYAKALGVYSIYAFYNELNKDVLLKRGQAHFALGYANEAIDDLTKCYSLDSLSFSTNRLLASYHVYNADTITGINILHDYIEYCKVRLQYKLDTIKTTQIDNNADINRLNTNIGDTHNIIAVLYHAYGDSDKSLNNYRQSLKYYDNYDARVGIGAILFYMKKYDEAYEEFNYILTHRIGDPVSLYFKGRCLIEKGEQKKGMKLIKDASNSGYSVATDYMQSNGW